MAKTTAKTATATDKKTALSKSKTHASSIDSLEKISEEVLNKFHSLKIEQQLQADLEWCLGSYRHDKNPSGLLKIIGKSFNVLKEEQTKKTKGVTDKLITDIEKILKAEQGI